MVMPADDGYQEIAELLGWHEAVQVGRGRIKVPVGFFHRFFRRRLPAPSPRHTVPLELRQASEGSGARPSAAMSPDHTQQRPSRQGSTLCGRPCLLMTRFRRPRLQAGESAGHGIQRWTGVAPKAFLEEHCRRHKVGRGLFVARTGEGKGQRCPCPLLRQRTSLCSARPSVQPPALTCLDKRFCTGRDA